MYAQRCVDYWVYYDLHGPAQQVMHSLKLRSMALAFPDKPIVPWPSYKSFSSRQ